MYNAYKEFSVIIKSICGYCGVGCGIEFDAHRLVGDLASPSNEGLICKKGASELETIQTPSRLLRPKLRHDLQENFEQITWDEAINIIASKLYGVDPQRIAFYLSGQMLTEDYYVANKLAKGFIGTNNVDTNSRSCMASAMKAYKKVFGIDYVPVRSTEIQQANLLILVGANTAEAHVVFHEKIKRAQKQGLKVVVIDPRNTLTAQCADLHLSIRPGTDIDFFTLVARKLIEDDKIDHTFIDNHVEGFDKYRKQIMKSAKTKLLKRSGIEKHQFLEFMELFYASENIITAWTMGINQSSQGVDKNLALINIHLLSGKINRRGNGPFSLTGQPNAMGGREVGGLSTTLAVHHDFSPQSIEAVSAFWKTDKIKSEPGLTAYEIIEAAERGEIETLIFCHTDPLYHLPNRKRVEAALKKIPFVVEINAYDNSESIAISHLRLPAAPWGEKEGTQTNMDRTITRQEKLTRTSVDCKADWQIFVLIAQALGFKEAFAFESAYDVFEEFKAMCKISKHGHMNHYEIDQQALKQKPFVWGEGLFDSHEYFTPSGKANLFYVTNQRRSEQTTLKYPFILLTGRTRDQWHSGTKTEVVESLKLFSPLSFVTIHASDAKKYGIADNTNVRVTSRYGEIIVKAQISMDVKVGTIFIPVTERALNHLTNDILDEESKQPDYNHTAVQIAKVF